MIIIGLGNPEKKFELTRHNAGFFMLDKIRASWNFPEFKFEKKFNAEISRGKPPLLSKERAGDEVILVKPQTFMNLSGDSTKSILDFYKLTPGDIIVIHDDIDIPLGKFKIAVDSSSAGHNGVQDIIDKLGTQKFLRFRIGIGQPKIIETKNDDTCPLPAIHNFVLEKFSAEELETIKKISEDILEEIKKLS